MIIYDVGHLAQLRKDAELNHIDFTRGSIEPASDGGFVVKLSPPIVDISGLLDPLPELRRTTRSVLQAEGHMLDSMMKIQRAERQKVRLGRVTSWSTADIVRTPLSDQEVSDYRAWLEHQRKVAKLQQELADALKQKQARQSAKDGAQAIRERYGVPAADPVQVPQASPEPMPAQPEVSVEALLQSAAPIYATRRTSRRGK